MDGWNPSIRFVGSNPDFLVYDVRFRARDLDVTLTANVAIAEGWIGENLDQNSPIILAARRGWRTDDIVLVQLYSDFCCLIYQIGIAGVLPPSLRVVLERADAENPIVGLDVQQILESLSRRFGGLVNLSTVDLRTLASRFYGPHSDNWHLSQFSYLMLGTSYRIPWGDWNWGTCHLRRDFLLAAVLDVYVTFMVYLILRDRHNQPLILAAGSSSSSDSSESGTPDEVHSDLPLL